MTEIPEHNKDSKNRDNLNESYESKNIDPKLDNICSKSEEILEQKIKLSYEGIKELITFISKQEKLSLKETLAGIDNLSKDDRDLLSSLSEKSFQSMKESIKQQKAENQNNKETTISSETIDPLVRKIFSEARCKNAQENINGNIPHHIDGLIIGCTQTIIKIGKVTIEIAKDFGKLIITDLPQLITGKAKFSDDYNI